ncbi:MAG: histidine kinase dimerization/phospho-acceptor domain-containing protein, partial [Chloroflexota bacterium]
MSGDDPDGASGELQRLRDEVARLSGALQSSQQRESALQSQATATADVLRAIASSPADLQPVIATVVEAAIRLCGADGGSLWEVDGDSMRSLYRVVPGSPPDAGHPLTRRISRRLMTGRAIVELCPVHVTDLLAESDAEYGEGKAIQAETGYRTGLAVPLVRESKAIGALVLVRMEVRSFSDREVALLEAFADQAVIAIENARLFQQVEEKSQQLEVASKHKSDFLANMSHELRTPLNAVIGYSEMLQEEAEDLEAEAFIPDLQKINAAGKHLLGLINDILDLSKIEAGKMELFLETVDVAALVQDVSTTVGPLLAKNGNELVIEVSPEVGEMEADATKLRQILFNLLGNAAKFTDHGRIELRVERGEGREARGKEEVMPAGGAMNRARTAATLVG